MYSHYIFRSFADQSSKHDLPNSNLFRYLQARDFVKTQSPHFPNRPPETNFDILQTNPQQNKLISASYKTLDTLVPKSTSFIKLRKEDQLQMIFPEQVGFCLEVWASHALIQCKVFNRVHYRNAELSKIYPTISHACNRCGLSPANHVHVFLVFCQQ